MSVLGFPAASILSRIDDKRQIPTNAILLTTAFLALLGLINIGSTAAFNAIVSLAVLGLELSYLVPICFLLYRRLALPDSLTYGPWRMGRLGIFVNVLSITFLIFTCVFLPFPAYQPVTAQNMNYASVVFGAVCIFSGVYWFVRGRQEYQGPLVPLTSSVLVNN